MSDPTKQQRIHRVQLDFSEKAFQQLLELQKAAGTETLSALVRDALGVYEWFTKEKNKNAEFLVRKHGEVEKVTFKIAAQADPHIVERVTAGESKVPDENP